MSLIQKFTLILALVILGCSETETGNSDDIFFAVDKSLLNPTFTDSTLGISFSPPKDWDALPESALHEAQTKLENSEASNDSLAFHLVQFFANSENSAFCTLTEVEPSSSLPSLDSLSQIYSQLLSVKFPNAEIRQGEFTNNGQEFVQFLIQLEDKILFKLISILPNKKIVQLDYAIARSVYPNYIKHIESSIGSISTSLH